MKFTKIKKVYEMGTHAYDDSQRETAVRVLLESGRKCWLVGYGGDYIPANQEEINNIYNIQTADKDIIACRVGQVVHARRY